MKYSMRPLSDRTWMMPGRRKASGFSSTWRSTEELLDRELRAVGASNVVIEVDVREDQLRLDGMIKANANAASPAVRLAFESKHGSMLFPCDRYKTGPYQNRMQPWQHNVRAIALTLEALRAAERHGAINTGQQYTGFKALPGGVPVEAPGMDIDEAWSIIGSYGELPVHELRRLYVSGLKGNARAALRRARARWHPDRPDGDNDLYVKVGQAARLIGLE